jgi:hypothetical protein
MTIETIIKKYKNDFDKLYRDYQSITGNYSITKYEFECFFEVESLVKIIRDIFYDFCNDYSKEFFTEMQNVFPEYTTDEILEENRKLIEFLYQENIKLRETIITIKKMIGEL